MITLLNGVQIFKKKNSETTCGLKFNFVFHIIAVYDIGINYLCGNKIKEKHRIKT